MREVAVVESVTQGKTVVSVKRNTACGDSCATCPAQCKQAQNTITVNNRIGAKPGDKVEIEMKTASVLKSAFLVYILPLVMFFLGYAAAKGFGFSEQIAVISAFLIFIMTFIVLHFYDKYAKNSINTTIIKVIEGIE